MLCIYFGILLSAWTRASFLLFAFQKHYSFLWYTRGVNWTCLLLLDLWLNIWVVLYVFSVHLSSNRTGTSPRLTSCQSQTKPQLLGSLPLWTLVRIIKIFQFACLICFCVNVRQLSVWNLAVGCTFSSRAIWTEPKWSKTKIEEDNV